MASKARPVPSRMNLQEFKIKQKAAEKGHSLLKKKLDALKGKFKNITMKLIEAKKALGDQAKEAFLQISLAEWAAGDFGNKVIDGVKKSSVRVNQSYQNVAGVKLPIFELRENPDADTQKFGIYGGAGQIEESTIKFKELLEIVVAISSLQTSFIALDKAIKVTSRRVNAQEYIVIPEIVTAKRYIEQELEEMAREDKFVVKKVQANNHKRAEELELEAKKIEAAKALDKLNDDQDDDDIDMDELKIEKATELQLLW